MFKIVKVSRYDMDIVDVRVRMDAKEWLKAKKNNGLGLLYGVDISNAVYRQYGVKAYNPTVQDRERSQGGIKWLTLTYLDKEWKEAPNNVIEIDFISKRRIA